MDIRDVRPQLRVHKERRVDIVEQFGDNFHAEFVQVHSHRAADQFIPAERIVLIAVFTHVQILIRDDRFRLLFYDGLPHFFVDFVHFVPLREFIFRNVRARKVAVQSVPCVFLQKRLVVRTRRVFDRRVNFVQFVVFEIGSAQKSSEQFRKVVFRRGNALFFGKRVHDIVKRKSGGSLHEHRFRNTDQSFFGKSFADDDGVIVSFVFVNADFQLFNAQFKGVDLVDLQHDFQLHARRQIESESDVVDT